MNKWCPIRKLSGLIFHIIDINIEEKKERTAIWEIFYKHPIYINPMENK